MNPHIRYHRILRELMERRARPDRMRRRRETRYHVLLRHHQSNLDDQ